MQRAHLHFALLLVVGAMCVLLAGCASRSPASRGTPGPGAVAADDSGYMRVSHLDGDTEALQIAVREFRPGRGRGPAIWLVGASHIGESNYFARLQARLETHGLVLFEGVGSGAGPRQERFDPDAAPSVQNTLATSLGLVFQLTAIDYDRPRFRNSDLNLQQLQELLAREGKAPGADEGVSASGEFEQLLDIMDGTSLLGMLVHGGIKLIGSSPKLREMTKLLLIETLGGMDGDLARMKGLPPALQQMLAVIIQERNKAVVRDLQAALRARVTPASIAVFYGAGHMADLEERLRTELGYRPRPKQWLTAVSVNTRRAGISGAELDTLRNLVRWQLKALDP